MEAEAIYHTLTANALKRSRKEVLPFHSRFVVRDSRSGQFTKRPHNDDSTVFDVVHDDEQISRREKLKKPTEKVIDVKLNITQSYYGAFPSARYIFVCICIVFSDSMSTPMRSLCQFLFLIIWSRDAKITHTVSGIA